MNYRMEEKQAFRIVGIKKRVPIIFSGVNPEISSMWESLDDGTINNLKKLSNIEPMGLLSASANFSEGRMEEERELDHYIGVATTNRCLDHLTQLGVPALTWVVFESIGPFQKLYRLFGDVFMLSGFRLRITSK